MMNFLTKIDRYILGKFLTTFFFFVLMMAVIICVIDYSQKIDDFVTKQAPVGELFIYFLVSAPSFITILFPLFAFLPTIFFTSKMANKTEIIAILATGTSFRRFLRAYIVGGVMLACLSLVTNHYLIPKSNIVMNDFLRKYFFDKKIGTDGNVHLKTGEHTYIYVENFTFATQTGTQFTIETIEGITLKEKLIADRIVYTDSTKEWTLKNVVIIKNEGIKETLTRIPEIKKKYNFTPEDLSVDRNVKMEMTSAQLLGYINREKERGTENVSDFEIELYKRTAQPVAGFILVIIAACIASRKVRGGSGSHLALGIIISALYILMMQLTSTFAINSGLHPIIAVWIPNIIFAVLAYVLYRRKMT
ncbi:hypothetical protein DBR32_00275 [Taibaiella sp. KBW10]|uniref:LptF/LptG family permease n=1 Tax=Taibaiella sp. KBW10 TaxID=2153357 RepID=UPI000F597CCD|nr:LptF/LptG family permease [Taibaiella sp. KBW10]RQO32085.1 hypothetical protein DBR32_00275 [Taibaiella sp. KBW10]